MKFVKENCLLIAHRGESFDAPENTLAAIDLAWKRGAKAVEVDVHLTADNQIVAIHDRDTARTGSQKRCISRSKLAELQQVDVGLFKSEQFSGERIPTIEQVFGTVPPNGKLVVEIKSSRRIIPFLLLAIAESSLSPEQIEIIGFSYRTMVLCRNMLPKHRVLWLLDLDYSWKSRWFGPSVKRIVRKTKEGRLDGVDLYAGKQLDEKLVATCKQEGLLVYCWTVDTPARAKMYCNWGIDGITTNRAGWMETQLANN